MTTHDWEDVKAEVYDAEDIEAIEAGAVRISVALRLVEIRQQVGLTQAEVAERMEVRQERVSAIERGDVTNLKLSTLIAYGQAIGGQVHLTVELAAGQHLDLKVA
jgi:transcriptional regulator with XRE-family HTH domain